MVYVPGWKSKKYIKALHYISAHVVSKHLVNVSFAKGSYHKMNEIAVNI